MRYSNPESDKSRTADRRAAVFVDYENLFSYLHGRIGSRGRPDELISEMLGELRRYLLEEVGTQTAVISAFADFSVMHGNGQFIQRSLYMRGVEPRFVPATLQKNAAEIQLCVDAIEILHNRPDVHTFVLVTGDRLYLPLVQHIRQSGSQTLIVTMSPPPSTSEFLPYLEEEAFVDAVNLLDETAQRALATGGSSSSRPSTPPGSPPARTRPHPVKHRPITHEGAFHALEIIEEHFGQYEEVYLTPLLRKLSELLDEDKYDPKSLISELEDAGAVWLEKRRGFPYDYTVLLIDTEHPDVETIQKTIYDRDQSDEGYLPYEDDDEAEAVYDDDEAEAVYEDDEAETDEEYYVDDEYEEDEDDVEVYEEEETFTNGAPPLDEAEEDNYEEDLAEGEGEDRA